MHISSVINIKNNLLPSIEMLKNEFARKEKKFNKIIKIGRTHTQDATPISLGQEFSGYKMQISNNEYRIDNALKELLFVAQGGTAVGTGINAPRNFDRIFCKNLSRIMRIKFTPAPNKFESISAHDSLVNFSSALNTLAVSLLKISNDIRMLASGPRAGLGELIIPENEPGSSIMPGKVNPTQIEALTMVCAQVLGNNTTILFGGSQGQFQLNAYKPVIIYNLLQSIKLLTEAINSFNGKCLKNIRANKKKIKENLHNSLMLVTALNPHIGYDNAAKIAKKAYRENISLKESAVKLNLVNSKKFDSIVKPEKMIK